MPKQKFDLNIDDKIYIYEEFCNCVVEYSIIEILLSREGVTYYLEAYNQNGDIINYRTCDEKRIGVSAFTSVEEAQKHQQTKA